jgi:hypothetical protein
MKLIARPVVASFSSLASSAESSGHFHWLYRYLYEKQVEGGASSGLTIGPKEEVASFVLPFFRTSRVPKIRVTFGDFWGYRVWALPDLFARLVRSGVTHLQFYDGGMAEFLIACRAADLQPNITVIYNFHWATDWLETLTRNDPIGRAFARRLAAVIRDRPVNLVLTAETAKFAQVLGDLLVSTFLTYPLISAFDPPPQRSWRSREVDLLLIPQRRTELEFTMDLARLAQDTGLTPRVLLTQQLSIEVSAKYSLQPGEEEMFLTAPLPHADYARLFSGARIVVLPYDKPYFKWGSSGKFNDAMTCGAFPFVPPDTAPSWQSGLPPELHELSWDPQEAMRSIQHRLQLGMPPDLIAPDFSTLLYWLRDRSSEHQPRVLSRWRVDILFLTLVSLAIRPTGLVVLSSIRRYLGGLWDRCPANPKVGVWH